jgi:hypothetical protein
MPKGYQFRHGRTHTLHIALTPDDRLRLMGWRRVHPWAEWRRALAVLLRADGLPVREIVACTGLTQNMVFKWLHRYCAEGVDGLRTRRRPPRPGKGGR